MRRYAYTRATLAADPEPAVRVVTQGHAWGESVPEGMQSVFSDLSPERADELADELRRLAAAVRLNNGRHH